MKNYVTRTFVFSAIYPAAVSFKDGAVVMGDLPAFTVDGEVTPEAALKYVRKKYGKDHQYVIKEVRKGSETYAMEVDEFKRQGVKVS